ncbi:unnamed protein product [Larinioides sclopetarius]|uniref:L-dopachrome isomerase n=1 Tax=Larinioides sclopetarius TaxID=280406 RepID=A0AAV1ZYY8_9ARAC
MNHDRKNSKRYATVNTDTDDLGNALLALAVINVRSEKNGIDVYDALKMPTFILNTNVSKDKIPEDFLKNTAKLVAELLKKPISYVVVHVNPDQLMSWGGTSDPCANAMLGSIGNLGTSENVKISKALFEHVKDTLGIKPDRMYITYVDLERANVGYMGTTFADM